MSDTNDYPPSMMTLSASARTLRTLPRFAAMLGVLVTGLATGACAHHAPPVDLNDLAPPPAMIDATIDPDPTHDPANVLLMDLSDGGRVTIRLMPKWAPHHVERIETLVKQGFYNGIIFHRVIDGFMAQTGDPTGTGQGGSKLPDLKAEFNWIPHVRGSVSMARTDLPDSANSQFFIVFYPHFTLDHHYTNFGRVIAGMPWADRIARGEPPAHPTWIMRAWMENDPMPPVSPSRMIDTSKFTKQINAGDSDAAPDSASSKP